MQNESTDYDNVNNPNDIILRRSQQEPISPKPHQTDSDLNNAEDNFKPFLNPLNPLNHVEKKESNRTKYFSWGKSKKNSIRNSGFIFVYFIENFRKINIYQKTFYKFKLIKKF